MTLPLDSLEQTLDTKQPLFGQADSSDQVPVVLPNIEMTKLDEIQSCCAQTIKKHASFNPMMVCDECKQIIKCFHDEKSFRNYLKFCESRRRQVAQGRSHGYYTIVFRSYDTYR